MLRFFHDYEYFSSNVMPMAKAILGLYLSACFGMWSGLNYAQYKNPDKCMEFNLNLFECPTSPTSEH